VKVHLIDGTYELFRSFYGAPSATSNGVEVGATRGLLRSFTALLRRPEVTHVACAFDHVIESFRNDLFAGYKTGAGIDPALYNQFGLAERATHALGMVTWPMVEFEADDAIATMAARLLDDRAVEQILLCSPDKDMMQCVQGSRVVSWDRRADKILDEAAVIEKFGIPPRAIPDYLGLVGDTADGIPGIPRWGAKSTAEVLRRYESIDAIPDLADRWDIDVRGKKTLAQNLAAQREDARLYKQLAILRTDVPLAERRDDLEWRGARRSELEALCAELGERDTLERIGKFVPQS
jgi:5'-3' exonuclease